MELFDTHAHLDFSDFKDDLPQVIEKSMQEGVTRIVNVGIDIHSSQYSLQLARDYDFIYASAGIHPHNAKDIKGHELQALKLLAAEEKVVVLGEMGLDYYRDISPRKEQEEIFRQQLALASELKMPVIIHDRNADRDVMQVLKEENTRDVGGIMHCFPGDWKMAKWCMDHNFLIGIGGAVTFKKSYTLQEVAGKIPNEHFVLETDCPFLSPDPKRGKRNEPAYLAYTASRVAELRNMDVEEVGYWTTNNALKFFNIS